LQLLDLLPTLSLDSVYLTKFILTDHTIENTVRVLDRE